MPTTRLAPSPTGALHLGNARTFLLNWLLARQSGWDVILRIEDIDGPRLKPGADQLALDDLRWLGIDWDHGPVYQTPRKPLYDRALRHLAAAGHTYPCTCTRKDIELAASAPHAADGAAIYPGTCRNTPQTPSPTSPAATRFRVPDEALSYTDAFAGPQSFHPARDLGDFVIQKADATPAYQLAVVVDDADMNVTHVVRGDDLLDSTPRQLLLYRALGLADRIPTYYHLPLVVGPDGRRLAKRHGDTRLATYRDLGTPPGRLLALLARWSNLPAPATLTTAADLLPHFDLARVPRTRVTFTPDDDAFLRSPR